MVEAQAVGPGFYPPTPRWLVQALLEEHPIPTDVVIDVGAGDGAITEVLVEAGKRVYCIEPRPECRRALEYYVGERRVFTGPAATELPRALELIRGRQDGWSIMCAPPFGPDELAAATMAPVAQHGGRCAAFLVPAIWLPTPPSIRFWHGGLPADAIYWPHAMAWFKGFGEAPVAWAVWDEALRAEGRQVHKTIGDARSPA